MTSILGTTKEMNRRKGGRFRRFQALDDSIQIFLYMQTHKNWFSTTDVIGFMEWENTHATRKRTRRLGEVFVRLGIMETKRVNGGSPSRMERFWRILE